MRMVKALILFMTLGTVPPAARADLAEMEQLRARVREQVRGMTIRRTAETLGLDTATTQKLSAVMARYGEQIDALRRESLMARMELHHFVRGAQATDARLGQLIDQILGNRARMSRLIEERNKEIRRLLTPAQFSRLIVLGPGIRRAVRGEVTRALGGFAQGMRPGGGTGGPGPMGDPGPMGRPLDLPEPRPRPGQGGPMGPQAPDYGGMEIFGGEDDF